MNKNQWFNRNHLLIILLLLFISGCTKQSLPLFYYTFDNSSQALVSQESSEQYLLIGPCHIASFLNKGQLVKQKSPYSVTIEEQHRWAGNLQEMVCAALIKNLSLDLGSNNIFTFPDNHAVTALQLELILTHFEEDTNGQALTQARWKIIDTTQNILYATTSTYIIKTDDGSYKSLVKGLSNGISRLSKDIAAAIRTVTPARE